MKKVFCLKLFVLGLESYCCKFKALMQFFKHSMQVLSALTSFVFVYSFLPILPDSQMLSSVEGCLGRTKLSACMAMFQPFASKCSL